jgi:hypothetical protein
MLNIIEVIIDNKVDDLNKNLKLLASEIKIIYNLYLI